MGRQHASTICYGGEREATGRQWVGVEMGGKGRVSKKHYQPLTAKQNCTEQGGWEGQTKDGECASAEWLDKVAQTPSPH